MSIWASTLAFDSEDRDEYDRPCKGAITYHGSHLYPDPDDRRATLDLAVIPGHIAEGGGYDETNEHGEGHRQYLRMGFTVPHTRAGKLYGQGEIVLDEEQVRELRDELDEFLKGVIH